MQCNAKLKQITIKIQITTFLLPLRRGCQRGDGFASYCLVPKNITKRSLFQFFARRRELTDAEKASLQLTAAADRKSFF
jgi:hypothetical protein